MNLALLKYIKSFTDGRIRIRHPALHRQATADIAVQNMSAVPGIESVESNTVSGSLLILYDPGVLGKAELIPMGEAWAEYFNAVVAGVAAEPPRYG